VSARVAVLDASALLAFLFDEPGVDPVAGVLSRSAISSANWAEVCQRLLSRNGEPVVARERLVDVGMEIAPLTLEDAEAAAVLHASTRQLGLSLGDRCCLALGGRLALPVLTADRAWARAEVGARVVVVR
jgi:ribonuclease VapC